VQKNTLCNTARPNARPKRNRPKRALAQFSRATHRSRKARIEKIDEISASELEAAFKGPTAEYDIDSVEAHVAQLAEQAWPWPWGSRLSAYAVAWAMGLNELFDPEGTRSEYVTTEELETSDYYAYEVKFEKLASSVAQEFGQLARIPPTEQSQFFQRVADNLACWIGRLDWYSNHRDFMGHLKQTKRSAAAFYRDLEQLRLKASEYSDLCSGRLMPSVMSRMLHYLPAFIDGIRLTLPSDEQQGKPLGHTQYPGLAEFIWDLEFDA